MGRDIGVGDPVKKDYIHACPAYVSVLCKKMLEKRINACAKARRRRDFVCVCVGGVSIFNASHDSEKEFRGEKLKFLRFFPSPKVSKCVCAELKRYSYSIHNTQTSASVCEWASN